MRHGWASQSNWHMGVVEHVTRYAPLNVHVSKHSAPHHCVHILSAQYDISSTDSRTPKFGLMNEVCGADVTTTACIYGGATFMLMADSAESSTTAVGSRWGKASGASLSDWMEGRMAGAEEGPPRRSISATRTAIASLERCTSASACNRRSPNWSDNGWGASRQPTLSANDRERETFRAVSAVPSPVDRSSTVMSTAAVWPAADRPGADRPGADRPGADRPGAERTPVDRELGDRAPVDRDSGDRQPVDRAAGRPATGRPLARRSTEERRSPVDRPWRERGRERHSGITASSCPTTESGEEWRACLPTSLGGDREEADESLDRGREVLLLSTHDPLGRGEAPLSSICRGRDATLSSSPPCPGTVGTEVNLGRPTPSPSQDPAVPDRLPPEREPALAAFRLWRCRRKRRADEAISRCSGVNARQTGHGRSGKTQSRQAGHDTCWSHSAMKWPHPPFFWPFISAR